MVLTGKTRMRHGYYRFVLCLQPNLQVVKELAPTGQGCQISFQKYHHKLVYQPSLELLCGVARSFSECYLIF